MIFELWLFIIILILSTLIFILLVNNFIMPWWIERKENFDTQLKKLKSLAYNKFETVVLYGEDNPSVLRGVGVITYKVNKKRNLFMLKKPRLIKQNVKLLSNKNITTFTFKELKALKLKLKEISEDITLEQKKLLHKIDDILKNPDKYIEDNPDKRTDITSEKRDEDVFDKKTQIKNSHGESLYSVLVLIFITAFLSFLGQKFIVKVLSHIFPIYLFLGFPILIFLIYNAVLITRVSQLQTYSKYALLSMIFVYHLNTLFHNAGMMLGEQTGWYMFGIIEGVLTIYAKNKKSFVLRS